jgi:hypothetical protein
VTAVPRFAATTSDSGVRRSSCGQSSGRDHGSVDVNAALVRSWNSAGRENTVTPGTTGKYAFAYPGMPSANLAIHVTAIGSGAGHCRIEFWNATSVNIGCYDASGAPANSAFSVMTSTGATRSGPVGGHVGQRRDERARVAPGEAVDEHVLGLTEHGLRVLERVLPGHRSLARRGAVPVHDGNEPRRADVLQGRELEHRRDRDERP